MKKEDIHQFFIELSEAYKNPVEIILIGGAASLLMGGSRPTMDIDFQIKLKDPSDFEDLNKSMMDISQRLGIAIQFSENVERWSSLSLLDFEKHVKLYREFTNVKVFLPDPIYWSIGKIGRYLISDCQDMIAVFKKTQPDPYQLAEIWSKCIQQSPRSEQLFLVKKYMFDFFSQYAKKIWKSPPPMEEIKKILPL